MSTGKSSDNGNGIVQVELSSIVNPSYDKVDLITDSFQLSGKEGINDYETPAIAQDKLAKLIESNYEVDPKLHSEPIGHNENDYDTIESQQHEISAQQYEIPKQTSKHQYEATEHQNDTSEHHYETTEHQYETSEHQYETSEHQYETLDQYRTSHIYQDV